MDVLSFTGVRRSIAVGIAQHGMRQHMPPSQWEQE
jgi:hypothetical protein